MPANDVQVKQAIADALSKFSSGAMAVNARTLFNALGYSSPKTVVLKPNTYKTFAETFEQGKSLNPKTALPKEWKSVDVVFQLTDDEIKHAGQIPLFESAKRVNDKIMQSYLLLAISLEGERYTRTELAGITREVNRLFRMPVLILFQHGQTLTLSIINRRLNKKDEAKDVLEKVTLIKDIRLANPHRAHLEILFDLSLPQLMAEHGCTNFVELHAAWQKTLDTSELNKRFFREVANWYFWALSKVTFPKDAVADRGVRNALSVIRLITRLIFVWFIREKGLVPDDLFVKRKIDALIKYDDSKKSTYYKAILQNLFFATLNQEMNTPGKSNRKFRNKAGKTGSLDQNYMIHTLYRYEAYFKDPQAALKLFATIPFLNGGLFECLDKYEGTKTIRVDGFSDRPDNDLAVPDDLFFGEERSIDLNQEYGTTGKSYKVRGLINIFDSYKFTIDENTPIEEEIALDPELLGKVFENLLATYNPETGVTARKQLGAFYTPREIVNYMVDEALLAYFTSKLSPRGTEGAAGLEERLRQLLSYTTEPHPFSPREVEQLIEAIDTLKAIDPACGSGAFPMGLLHKLVFILGKLDPHNTRWKERQIDPASKIEDAETRERAIADIEEAFERNELDYGRKLYLIENCIYGVDIQPIAVQIAKLRCFISLVVDQRVDDERPNRGIRPLPNLETKFVAANTLLGIERPALQAEPVANPTELDPKLAAKEEELADVLRQFHKAQSPGVRQKYRGFGEDLCKEINALRRKAKIEDFLEPEGLFSELTSLKVALNMLLTLEQAPTAKTAKTMALRSQTVDEKEKELAEVRHRYMTARTPQTKNKYREQDTKLRSQLAELLHKDGFAHETTEMLAYWDPYDQNVSAGFFDPEWMFGVSDKFDISIGNPPYIKEYVFREAFNGVRGSVYYQGKMDIWYMFACLSLDYLKKRTGVLTFIATNNWVTNAGASKFRNKMVSDSSILKLIDFGDFKIFESADIQTMILICARNNEQQNYEFDLRKLVDARATFDDVLDVLNKSPNDKAVYLTPAFERAYLKDKLFVFADTPIEQVLNKLAKQANFLLDERDEVAQGIVAPQDAVNNASKIMLGGAYEVGEGIFVLSDPEKKTLGCTKDELALVKPYYTTSELHKYYGDKENSFWIIYTDSSFKDPKRMIQYPHIRRHLDKFAAVITSDNYPYGLHRSRDEKFFRGEKIVSARKCAEPTFTYTDFDCYVSQTFYVIKSTRIDLKFLTALLNSKLVAFWLRHKGKMQGHQFQIDKEPLLAIPIFQPNSAKQAPITRLFERIIVAKQSDLYADTSTLERKIDELVYQLYGLTAEEIRIVEGG